MEPALVSAIVIACCFVAGVFETGRRKRGKGEKDGSAKAPRKEGDDGRDA